MRGNSWSTCYGTRGGRLDDFLSGQFLIVGKIITTTNTTPITPRGIADAIDVASCSTFLFLVCGQIGFRSAESFGLL